MKKLVLMAMLLIAIIVGCSEDPVSLQTDDYDRGAMLEHWADNIIIPAHQAYNTTALALHTKSQTFHDSPTPTNLEALRTAWMDSYMAWQSVPFFILGKGEDVDVLISLYTNIYPTKTSTIDFFLDSGNYDLSLSSNKATQGFPALDYMLYGLAEADDAILAFYTTDPEAAQYRKYLLDLTNRVKTLSNSVYNDWTGGYRDKFVSNTGGSNSASVNKVVNDFIYSYEFDIRTSKVGFPSGACIGCAGEALKSHVEAPYRKDLSKKLLSEALDAAQNFYNGVPFNGSFDDRGTSLYQYLDYLGTERNGEKLSDVINDQFDKSRVEINKLGDDLTAEVENRNEMMVSVHDQLQLNVVLLKTYMMDALNVSQDYVSSDGD